MKKIYRTDRVLFDKQSRRIYGDMEWTFQEYHETDQESLEDAIGAIKYVIDECSHDDENIEIYEIYDDTNDKHELVYKIANCTEDEARLYGIECDLCYYSGKSYFVYQDVYSVIVTDKELNYELLGTFSTFYSAEHFATNDMSDYWYYLDRDLENESMFCWEGDDGENHLITL